MMMRWVVAAAVLLVLVAGRGTAAIQCSEAVSKVLPCEGFMLGGAATPRPSAACCSAVQSLDNMAEASGDDRRAICKCFKGIIATSFPINIAKAQLIPKLCNVTIGFAVKPDIDCDRI